MSLSFQNPAGLAALSLAALPWILHRWSQSRAKPLPFPSLELLRASIRSSFASSRISHRMLLLLRTLLALALGFLIARPVYKSGGRSASDGPLTVLLAVDVSASMGAGSAGRSALDWAREQALPFLPGPGSAERTGLIAFSDRIERTEPFSADPGRLREALASLEPTARPTRVEEALKAARALFAAEGKGDKVLLLFTDAARNGWRFPAPPPFEDGVRLVAARAPAAGPNAGITALRPAAAPGDAGRLEAASWGGGPALSRGWTLSWEGKPAAQGRVSLGAVPGTASVPFAPVQSWSRGELSLDPDAAAWDDVFHALPPAGGGAAVLVVNGAPALAPIADETYFLEPAASALKRTGLRTKTVLPAAVDQEPLEPWDVVMLANTPRLSPRAEERLRGFVERGGGLWATAGDRFDPGALAALLPARPTGRIMEDEGVRPAPEGLREVPGRRLAEEGGFDWDELRMEKMLEAEPAPGGITILAGTSSGKPLLSVGRFGRGQTAFLAVPIDRDWGNLPAHPVFPVLCRELWTFLAGREPGGGAALTVDHPWEGTLPPGISDALVERPDGGAETPDLRGNRFRYEKTDRPGFYTLRSRRDGAVLARAAVNADRTAEEGDPTTVETAEAEKLLPFKDVAWIPAPEPVKERFDRLTRGRPLTGPLAVVVFLLLGLETAALGLMKK